MTIELEPNKRYRWTVEGTAVERPLVGVVLQLTDGHHVPLPSVGKIELLPDPLPTTPGSVIRYEDLTLLRQHTNSSYPWIDPDGETWAETSLEGATVLFDASCEQ